MQNLLKAGHECTIYDIVEEAAREAVGAGAVKCESAAQAASGRELVITMLPNSPQVKQVVLGENGIADAKAVDGTLSIMVGGKKEVYDKVKEVLLCMGSSAVYCGELGAGNTTKLANQIVVALNIAACAEAFTLSKKAGVDPELVFDAIRGGLAGSTVMDAKVPMMLDGNDKPGFKIDLHIKDLKNALETGHGMGMGLPLTAQVMEMMQQLAADGFGGKDHSALVKYYEKMTGESIRR